MPRSACTATRAQLIDWICERLTSGWTLQQVASLPHTPAWDTLMRWQRADPALKARFANARAGGLGVRFQARHADRFCYPSADAQALVERVRAGERLTDLVAAGHPDRPTLNAQMAARAGPTPALMEEIGARIAGGATLGQVAASPDMPHCLTLAKWRRERPDFAAVIEDACDFRDWISG